MSSNAGLAGSSLTAESPHVLKKRPAISKKCWPLQQFCCGYADTSTEPSNAISTGLISHNAHFLDAQLPCIKFGNIKLQKSALRSGAAAAACNALDVNALMKSILFSGLAISQSWYRSGGKTTTMRFSSVGL